jgi:hypothetical protein
MDWLPNSGELPDDCLVHDENGNVIGHRAVHVRLFGGYDSQKAGAAPWPAVGARIPTRWAIGKRPHPFEIEEYLIV